MAEGPAEIGACVFFRDTPDCFERVADVARGQIGKLLPLGCALRFICAVPATKRTEIFRRVMDVQPAIQFCFLSETVGKAEAMHFGFQQATSHERYFMWFDSATKIDQNISVRLWLTRAIRQLRVADLVGAVYRSPVSEQHCVWLQKRICNYRVPCPKYVNYVSGNWFVTRRDFFVDLRWPDTAVSDDDMDVLLGLLMHAKKFRVNHFRDNVCHATNSEKRYVESAF